MNFRSISRATVLLGALVMLLASCESLRFSMMKDDELVAGGIQSWNTDKFAAARAYWNAIKAPALRSEWLGRMDQYDALELAFDNAEALPPTPEAPLLDAWNKALTDLNAFPAELKLPDTFLNRLVPLAKAVVRGRLDAEKNNAAKEFMKIASEKLGNRIEWSAELQEIQDYDKAQATAASYKALERSLDKSTSETLASARGQEQFDDKIAGYEVAITAFTKAESTLLAQAKTNGYKEGSALWNLADKYRKRRGDTRAEMEKTLRDRAYDFKERIGGEFARTPDELGSSDPGEVVKFYESIKTNIEAMQAEVIAFAGKYPKIIDKDMLKDVDDQKKALEARIAVVTAEWRKAQADAKIAAELASRGKPVAPLQIGLFNPQPGTKGNDAKSRPAKFKGTLDGDAVYWWGMVDIPAGTLNDLVFTAADNRPIRVFSDNTLSGKKIEEKKLKDLVNRQYKVGNSWPVINAGAQLTSGKYFFEVGKGKDAKYSGDVVVYSSFIVRMR
jgi:hypothetical protein